MRSEGLDHVGIIDGVAARSKAYVCGHLVAGVSGSNPARSMDVYLFDLSSRGVLPCVSMCVIKKPRKGRPYVHPGL
jgi:hypothetical protein